MDSPESKEPSSQPAHEHSSSISLSPAQKQQGLKELATVSLGLMAGVVFTLGRTALVDWVTLVLVVLAAIEVFRFKVNSVWIVLAGGIIGFIPQHFLYSTANRIQPALTFH